MTLKTPPTNILLIKSHSMGIGDLLRSSAAWSALKSKWPDAKLHFLMLSNHAGYPSEAFIRSHYLLSSAQFVTVKSGDPGQSKQQQKLPVSEICRAIEQALAGQAIDLVIDFETGGLKTPWITRWIAKRKGAYSVGIAQFPLRGWFYDAAAPSSREYQREHGLARQMDYTEKDFVALAALGIVRNGTRITLHTTAPGAAWQLENPRHVPAHQKMVVLNIGCGTLDALLKRPDLSHLADCMLALFRIQPFQLHLSGAPFEQAVNAEFAALLQSRIQAAGLQCALTDWAGQLSLEQLSGLLAQADLVVSSDSGPYHMAVAVDIPTLCLFNFDTPPSYHTQRGVECLILPDVRAFVSAAQRLLTSSSGE
jgi:ADP-heptose:LPS heptosyltransferase